ncbi:uncharacterized protein [Vicugna pacos]|uniref:Uncharacterized protein isoform X2 n=1 Tax=Vicugna pacos TaxID=30538 RepID=A0ABM5BWT6_VICPA
MRLRGRLNCPELGEAGRSCSGSRGTRRSGDWAAACRRLLCGRRAGLIPHRPAPRQARIMGSVPLGPARHVQSSRSPSRRVRASGGRRRGADAPARTPELPRAWGSWALLQRLPRKNWVWGLGCRLPSPPLPPLGRNPVTALSTAPCPSAPGPGFPAWCHRASSPGKDGCIVIDGFHTCSLKCTGLYQVSLTKTQPCHLKAEKYQLLGC